MNSVFLAGPMAWPPLLEIIAGPEGGCQPAESATVFGFELKAHPDKCFPIVMPEVSGKVEGVLLRPLSGSVLERINYFAAGLGCVSVRHEARTAEGRVQALAHTPAHVPAGYDLDWIPGNWVSRWGDMALLATAEAMRHLSRFSPEDLSLRMPMILARAASRIAARRGVPADLRSTTGAGEVECLIRHTRHAGFFLTEEYELRYPSFDGRQSPVVRREAFVATDAAIVLPYDPVRDRVLLVEQFRLGPYGRGDPLPWILEPVAGRVDAGETPEQTAYRECEEEAGLTLKGLERIASYYCTPGYSTEYFHCYLGLCNLPDTESRQGGLATEDEDIRTHILSFGDAMALCASGEANNGPLILSLIWLQRERDRLRSAA